MAFASICSKLDPLRPEANTGQFKDDKRLNIRSACFVSIHLLSGELRGCIGSIEPRYDSLFYEIHENAIAAATRDSRFTSLKAKELNKIELKVDLLTPLAEVADPYLLNPKTNGLVLSDGLYRRAVLLPDLPGIDTVEEQIKILIRKAGLQDCDPDQFKFHTFTSERFL